MNEQINAHPKWQQTIRQAQTKQQEQRAIEQQELDKVNADVNAKAGVNLARILKLAFDIDIAAPPENKLILDGFEFWFSNFKEVVDGEQTRLFFNLYVNPARPSDIDWDNWVNAACFEARGKGLDEDWTTLRANLASELDRMSDDAKSYIKQHKQRQNEKANAPTPKITIESLIRAIARDVLAEHTES